MLVYFGALHSMIICLDTQNFKEYIARMGAPSVEAYRRYLVEKEGLSEGDAHGKARLAFERTPDLGTIIRETTVPTPLPRDPITLTPWQRGRIAGDAVREVRSLPGLSANLSGVTVDDPTSDTSWLVDLNLPRGNGVRLRKFSAHDGTLEMITVAMSFKTTQEGKRISVPSQILWQDFTRPQLNTDIAVDRFYTAMDSIRGLINRDRSIATQYVTPALTA